MDSSLLIMTQNQGVVQWVLDKNGGLASQEDIIKP